MNTLIFRDWCFRFYFPICYLEGVHIDFERLSGWMSLKSEQDYLDLIQRYESFPQQAQGILEVLKKAVSEHMVFHAISMVSKSRWRSHLLYERI